MNFLAFCLSYDHGHTLRLEQAVVYQSALVDCGKRIKLKFLGINSVLRCHDKLVYDRGVQSARRFFPVRHLQIFGNPVEDCGSRAF